MKIFLIGYMGSGKTTLGRKLANEYYFRFIDMDEYIENKYQTTINDIFAKQGENAFREYEREVIAELSNEKDVVIATGGGTPCFFDNMEQINANGLSIYIRTNAQCLSKRLIDATIDRPLIKNKSNEELLMFIEKTLEHREKFYMQSQDILNNNNKTVKQAYDELILIVKTFENQF